MKPANVLRVLRAAAEMVAEALADLEVAAAGAKAAVADMVAAGAKAAVVATEAAAVAVVDTAAADAATSRPLQPGR